MAESFTFQTGDYFDITADGMVSLKTEYRGKGIADYPYSISDNGADTVGSLIQNLPKNLQIPDIIDGINVVSLSSGMFYKNDVIEKIMLPTEVIAIPEYFCFNAKNFIDILNTEEILSISDYSFANTPLKKAYFPKVQSLGSRSFIRCAEMTNVVLSNDTSFTTIPISCFNYCCNLISVFGGSNITTIGKSAFKNCYKLSYIPNIIKGLETAGSSASVGEMAFYSTNLSADIINELNSFEITFGTNATAVQLNPTTLSTWIDKQSSGLLVNNFIRTPSVFNQADKRWADVTVGSYINSPTTKKMPGTSTPYNYYNSCTIVTAYHAYCSIRNYHCTTIEQVENQLLADAKKLDEIAIVAGETATHETDLRAGFVAYDPSIILKAVGISFVMKTTINITETELVKHIDVDDFVDTFYQDFQTNGICGQIYYPSHVVFCTGTDANGNISIIDSGSASAIYDNYSVAFGTFLPQNVVSEAEYYTVFQETKAEVFNAKKSLADNVAQAIKDFDSIKNAIINKGVPIPQNTATNLYASKIESLEIGDSLSAHGVFTPNEDTSSFEITGLPFKPKQFVINAVAHELSLGMYAEYGQGCPPANSSYVVLLCLTDKYTGGDAVLDYCKGRIVLYKSTDGTTATRETGLYIKDLGGYPSSFEFNNDNFKIHFTNTENFGQMLFKSGIPYYWSVTGE